MSPPKKSILFERGPTSSHIVPVRETRQGRVSRVESSVYPGFSQPTKTTYQHRDPFKHRGVNTGREHVQVTQVVGTRGASRFSTVHWPVLRMETVLLQKEVRTSFEPKRAHPPLCLLSQLLDCTRELLAAMCENDWAAYQRATGNPVGRRKRGSFDCTDFNHYSSLW